MKKTSMLIMGTALFLCSSCASIVSKSSWPVTISSTPSEARISITDKKGVEIYTGYTPVNLKLKSGSGFFGKARYQVKFTKEGYESKTVPVEFKLNGWYFGNLLLGGAIGMLIIDPATGAMYRIENDVINEALLKTDKAVSIANEPGLKIMDIKDIPQSLRTQLVEL